MTVLDRHSLFWKLAILLVGFCLLMIGLSYTWGRHMETRNAFLDELKARGVGCSVHWRPLHLHPYYQQTFGWRPEDLPVATAVWERLVSLPLFPGMRNEEVEHVIATVQHLCAAWARKTGPEAGKVFRQ